MVNTKRNLTDVTVVLQARTSSSRLPAKVLLPVGGYPLAVLAAKRAGNTGLKVLVATSNSADDDILHETLKNHDINTYRGSLDNVLERFIEATLHLNDSTIIVRLTGDNAFPDGHLIEELVNHYRKTNFAYVSMGGVNSGVPYGISAEVAFLKIFREANLKSTTNFEREHVTPFIKSKYGTNVYEQSEFKGYANLRCTIDHYDDYILVSKIFSKFIDPINASIKSLIKELAANEPDISP